MKGEFLLSSWPLWAQTFFSIILLDVTIYWQHRVFHKVPYLWRFHSAHHSDPFFETTTALRFHPVEIVLSYTIKGIVIYCFGLSAIGVLIFDIILNFSALFNHSNSNFSQKMENILSPLFVTPGVHLPHHFHGQKGECNYGFFLSIWDKVFGSYVKVEIEDQRNEPLGMSGVSKIKLLPLLLWPFRKRRT